MGNFSFIPEWIIPDILIYVSAIAICGFIIKKEEQPGRILLELICFCFLYAAVYENFATVMKWYGYGRSILMIGNVPLSVPVIEYLVVYAGLRMAQALRIPEWTKPFFVGFQAMIFDFSLDPVSVKLVRDSLEGRIGRWTWFPAASDAQILGEPVYNFTGWILLAGWAAAFLILGRFWWKASGKKSSVAILYPILAMVAALLLLVSPLSRFLLWLAPFMGKGSWGEWIMLGVHSAFFIAILAAFWRGRMRQSLGIREEWPVYLVFGGFHAVDLALCAFAGSREAFFLVLAASIVQWALLGLFALRGRAFLRRSAQY
jgi:hypothetical protein